MTMGWLLVLGLIGPIETPKVLDDRLTITLFASEPEIVTPTGIAVDGLGRVLTIESHTHFRPEGYDGPPADRIRAFEDTDGDGQADRITTLFEGTRHTMALAFGPDGWLYVATRSEIFRLHDGDGDGQAEVREPIVHLDTPGDYPHNGLSGFAFDFKGDVYFGLGENLGAPYTLVGSDGTTLSGGGEGGNVYRCHPDGTSLERVATGFWNPFAPAFDAFGRLFVVDNDPDSRPPCRLLHIVEGGDYGFRFRNGRKGIHPFTSWNGELPGTLPMVSGTGEAPSGIVAYESDGLPDDYRGTLLVTSWGDHRIERHRLREHGASFWSAAEPIIVGGEDFRPVGLVAAPDGSLFVSDWVDKSYNVHGKGRIWHIRATKGGDRPRTSPDRPLADPDRRRREATARRLAGEGDAGREALARAVASDADPRARAVALEALIAAGEVDGATARSVRDDASADVRALAARSLPAEDVDLKAIVSRDSSPLVRAEAMRRLDDLDASPVLVESFTSDDPFLRQAARRGLGRSLDLPALLPLAGDPRPSVRLGVLLVLRDTGRSGARKALPGFLADPDPDVRFAAIQWVGEEGLLDFRPDLAATMTIEPVTRPLFEGYLAALERLDGTPRLLGQERGGQDYVAALLADPRTSPAIRRHALRVLEPDHPALTLDLLKAFLDAPDPDLMREAVRSLRESVHADRLAILADLAGDPERSEGLRAEAVAGLTGDDPGSKALLLRLASGPPTALRREALRSLRGVSLTEDERDAITTAARGDDASIDLLGTLNASDRSPDAPGTDDLDAWLARLDGPADPAAGERVFFHPKGPRCASCHEIDGRGSRIGPDLSTTGRVLDRRRLVESIVLPSREVAPMFVPWLVARPDGSVFTGLLLGETLDGGQIYADSEGKTITLKAADIAERSPQSTSIMPAELAHAMTIQEFRDLLAFLRDRTAGEPDGR